MELLSRAAKATPIKRNSAQEKKKNQDRAQPINDTTATQEGKSSQRADRIDLLSMQFKAKQQKTMANACRSHLKTPARDTVVRERKR